ncbi:hypothetical protein [Polyangium aurulentum]|uniref:hypothetical protein n=1 Tax=Polyangium aurulentum TaxID=2567896 RepID=UPI0010AE9672|nr:hypothetical protein [Polyangium aurulentum]UQA57952.1 hypothetical protein E8A73_042905 [Polyangium aurulentum]
MAFFGALLFVPVSAMAAKPSGGGPLKEISVSGALQDGRTFAGKLSITHIDTVDGKALTACGSISGAVKAADGTSTIIADTFCNTSATLTQGNGLRSVSCDILVLDLGPLFLDGLGLYIGLSEIILDIDAKTGAGKLLGSLLCTLFGQLDKGAPLSETQETLDRINDLLG